MNKTCVKKSLTFAVILLLISVSVAQSTSSVVVEKTSLPTNRGKTLYVGGTGEGNYSSIQAAINDANDGDTVFVFHNSSPYYENVWVDKSINLIGEDKNTTIIDGQDDEHYTVIIISPYVTLTGFTIQYCTNVDGIGILINAPHGDSHNNTIYGNIIRNTNKIGIGLYDSSNNNIYRNNITNHDWGIFAEGFYDFSSHNSIYQNNIMKNRKGIYFSMGFNGGTNDNRVYQNNFFLNSINAIDDGSANQWDNGSIGNFWDDYKGKDEDGNGIGDEPYWISKKRGIKDNYPLMKPYGNITSYNKNSQSIISNYIRTLSRQSTKSFIPSIENLLFNNDTTPPVTTISLDPPTPDGYNGWYVSDVNVTLNATDDMSGVKEIRYRIESGPWQTIPGDHVMFIIDQDGNNLLIEYYAIDNAGNEESRHLFSIDMDQTEPEVNLRWDAIKKGGKWYISFIADCRDATSGMNRVEFYVNTKLKEIVTGPGPIYNWTTELDISYSVFGLICNLEITEENIRFFAIIVRTIYDYYPLPSLHDIMAQAYDNAGNSDLNFFVGGCPPPFLRRYYYHTHFALQKDYKGYIGIFFIHATFEEGPLYPRLEV